MANLGRSLRIWQRFRGPKTLGFGVGSASRLLPCDNAVGAEFVGFLAHRFIGAPHGPSGVEKRAPACRPGGVVRAVKGRARRCGWRGVLWGGGEPQREGVARSCRSGAEDWGEPLMRRKRAVGLEGRNLAERFAAAGGSGSVNRVVL
jgi:hypothetical protein